MRKFLVILVMLMLVIPGWAEACNGCGDKNHNNIHNKYYGGKGGNASAFSISQQWVSQTQSMNVAPGAFTSNVTTGPTNVTTGPTNVSVSVSQAGGGSGGSGEVSGYLIQNFPEPYITIPAAPLAYNGPVNTASHYSGDQIWFKRQKWMKEMVENLPNGGKIRDALFEKTQPINFFYVRDGREKREWCEDFERPGMGVYSKQPCAPYKPQGYYLGNIYCESNGPGDKPGLVWGGCSRKLLEKGCSYAVLESGVITHGARSNAVNQSGGVSLAGIFGAIFGFNAGAGASNTDHEATVYEIVNLTWGCYGK